MPGENQFGCKIILSDGTEYKADGRTGGGIIWKTRSRYGSGQRFAKKTATLAEVDDIETTGEFDDVAEAMHNRNKTGPVTGTAYLYRFNADMSWALQPFQTCDVVMAGSEPPDQDSESANEAEYKAKWEVSGAPR